MSVKRTLSVFENDRGASLFKKKLVVFLILACMTVNGFVSNRADGNKFSFIIFFANISQNAAVQLLGKCGNSILAVTSKVCTDITKMMMPSGDQPVNDSKENKKRENTSNDYAVIINPASSLNKWLIMSYEESKSVGALFFAQEKIFSNYSGDKIRAEGVSCLLILFLIFVVAIRQRKGRVEEVIAINNALKKTRISA